MISIIINEDCRIRIIEPYVCRHFYQLQVLTCKRCSIQFIEGTEQHIIINNYGKTECYCHQCSLAKFTAISSAFKTLVELLNVG